MPASNVFLRQLVCNWYCLFFYVSPVNKRKDSRWLNVYVFYTVQRSDLWIVVQNSRYYWLYVVFYTHKNCIQSHPEHRIVFLLTPISPAKATLAVGCIGEQNKHTARVSKPVPQKRIMSGLTTSKVYYFQGFQLMSDIVSLIIWSFKSKALTASIPVHSMSAY